MLWRTIRETSDKIQCDETRHIHPEPLATTEAEIKDSINPDLQEFREVAERPADGHIRNFLKDLKSLFSLKLFKATIQEFIRDDAMGLAAQLAYYLILALFPLILVIVSLLGTFGNPELASTILTYFQQVMPAEVYQLFNEYLGPIISGDNPAPGLLSFGILFTLWSASGAFAAMINALNRAYDVQETRPFWKVRGLAILMTIGLSVIVLTGVVLLVFGPGIGSALAGIFNLSEEFEVVWAIVRWPVALMFMVLAVALLFYFAPDAGQPFRWITPGGIVGVLLWVTASIAFSLYVNNFGSGSYNETYGSIGVVIVLLLYLYIASLTILFGATLNSTLVRMKEEISGEKVLEAEPLGDRPDIFPEDDEEPPKDGERNL